MEEHKGSKRKREDDEDADSECTKNVEWSTKYSPLHYAAMDGDLDEIRKILSSSPSVNVDQLSDDGFTPLYLAVVEGNTEAVKELAKAGADLHRGFFKGMGYLHAACAVEREDVMRELLRLGCPAEGPDPRASPLIIAVDKGSPTLVRILLENGANANRKLDRAHTVLFQAVYLGFLDVVKLLLEFGANANEPNELMVTPLHMACQNASVAEVKELIKYGANLDTADTNGNTALHIAAMNGHIDVMKVLLEAGAPINSGEHDGRTPLLCACAEGNTGAAQLLLQHGAKLDVEMDHWVPLMYAARGGHIETVKALLHAGADVNWANNEGATPIVAASKGGHVEVVKVLLDHGAIFESLPVENELNIQPLHNAAALGHLEVAKLLISRGANAKFKANYDVTPLHFAAKNGHLDLVKLLLSEGAEVSAMDALTGTPLSYAAEFGKLSVVKLLLDHGADVDELGYDDPEEELNPAPSPLFLAASGGHEEVVKELLHRGASLDHLALFGACKGGHVATSRTLIRQGVDLKAEDTIGYNIVKHTVAYETNTCEILELLGRLGVCWDKTPNLEINPALHMAAQLGAVDVVETLLKFGAANRANSNGLTPLEAAKAKDKKEVVEFLSKHQTTPVSLHLQCVIFVNSNMKLFDQEKLKSLPEAITDQLIFL